MQSVYPPRPPYPPRPGPVPGKSDRDLVAQLRGKDGERHYAVALLLARHWLPARDYALLCLASATPTAQLVATSAFHQVLGRLTGGTPPSGALRPQLLVAVRETVRTWAADDGICAAIPELRKPTGGRGLHSAKPGAPASRRLAERAFTALPGASQCLLWHTEVEAEPINIPAGLLGIDTATARVAAEQVREQFRVGLVRAHKELAPSPECRFYNRLLDVPIRRGGTLLPDVQQHLAQCTHCRYAADQLGHFEGGLGLLLADAVLGWGGRRYLASRPGRGALEPWSPAAEPAAAPAPPAPAGRHRTASERRHTAAAVAVGLASLALLAAVLAAHGWSDDDGLPRPSATWGIPAVGFPRPGATGLPATASAAGASLAEPGAGTQGSLRNVATGRCLAIKVGQSSSGTGIRLTECSSAGSQQWSYEFDGVLRSTADPALCLAADPEARSVRVAPCAVHAGEAAYILTGSGELLLRRSQDLALAAKSGRRHAHVVVADRDGSGPQRWVLGDHEDTEAWHASASPTSTHRSRT
ncbi:RICIN domain-containing protein [Streptomyces sp. NPDC005485]|uniref:RICIN domain-containing protein n=1 Tax=Streptomyces sp. NPDC005485 TaxID=3155591 RepID=UPI0033A6A194